MWEEEDGVDDERVDDAAGVEVVVDGVAEKGGVGREEGEEHGAGDGGGGDDGEGGGGGVGGLGLRGWWRGSGRLRRPIEWG